MKILMVLTSHDKLGNTGRKTGFWLEEFAAPYYMFKDAGAEMVLASPKGGQPPLDPKSNEPNFPDRSHTPVRSRCRRKGAARIDGSPRQRHGRRTSTRSSIPAATAQCGTWRRIELDQAAGVLPAAGKAFAVVCHSSGALRHVKTPDGKLFVEGKTVTGFTNGEEEAVGLTKVVPFLVEDELMSLGATFSKVRNWGAPRRHRRPADHRSNPASSGPAAKLLIDTLNEKAR